MTYLSDFPSETVLVICGPTGVGKTALSLALAERVPVEIVSADSRQIYRYMDIGTAKPSPAELARVPHHFIDIFEPDRDYSAGEYSRDARRVIAEIFQRGRLPLVVGGSGLYLRALLQGFFDLEIKDEDLRRTLKNRLKTDGIAALYAEFARVDPELAAKTHPNSVKRVLRALEVYYLTGKPLSKIQREHRDPAPFSWVKIGLTMERQKLYARINRRVEEMFDAGLVAEVRGILQMGYAPTLNALNSVGYKEVMAYLQGEMDLFACKEAVKQNTRRYAKRQLTWFRRESDVQWVDVTAAPDLPELAGEVIKRVVTL